ncbi:MAG: hypothetical protein ACOCRO_09365 [Halanaerobiales bacterium]
MDYLIINDKPIPLEHSDNNSKTPEFINETETTDIEGNSFRSHSDNYSVFSFRTIPLPLNEFKEIYDILSSVPPFLDVSGELFNGEDLKMDVVSLNDDDFNGLFKRLEFELEEVL